MAMKFLPLVCLSGLLSLNPLPAFAQEAQPNAAVTAQMTLLRLSTELWQARLGEAVARAENAQLQLQLLEQTWASLTPVFIKALGGDPSTHTLDRATGALAPIPAQKETSRGPANP